MKKYFDGSKRMIAEKNVRWRNTFLMYAVDFGKVRYEEENYVLLDENGNNLHTLKKNFPNEDEDFKVEENIQVDMVREDYEDIYVKGGRETFFGLLNSGVRIKSEMRTYIDKRKKKKVRDPNTLVVLLKAKWYDMIARGEKKEEYRETTKEFWRKRLYNPDGSLRVYQKIRFQRGYTDTTFECKFEGTYLGYGNPDWGAPEGKVVFCIRIGEIIK